MTKSGRTRPGQAPQKGRETSPPHDDPGDPQDDHSWDPGSPDEAPAPRRDAGPGDDPDTQYGDYVPA
jgi:hypothetical protein